MSKNVEVNRLLQLASQIFALTHELVQANKESVSLDEFRKDIVTEFIGFERRALSENFEMERVQDCKFALSAYVDEMILIGCAEYANKWMVNPLQLDFFGEHLAGERFFEKLQQLRQAGVQKRDAVEVYFMCLQLGFKGMYRVHDHEKLYALQSDIRNQLDYAKRNHNAWLSPHGVVKTNPITEVSKHWPMWVLASVTAASVLVTYLGFSMTIEHQAKQALNQIQTARSQ